MGFGVRHQKGSEKDGLEIFLTGIIKDAEKTEKEMLRESGKIAQQEVQSQLRRLKRGAYDKRGKRVNRKGVPALADDVKLSVRKNNWGELTAQVRGGKKTGTLWHIVNDGNLYSSPTFFLDQAILNLDRRIDGIWDKVGKILK